MIRTLKPSMPDAERLLNIGLVKRQAAVCFYLMHCLDMAAWMGYRRAMSDDIIIRMQEMIAHQQTELERMSEELYTQQQEISLLRRQVKQLGERIRSGGSDEEAQALMENRKPPHY
jgi:SlyX protein